MSEPASRSLHGVPGAPRGEQSRGGAGLYPRSRDAALDLSLFHCPTAEYRGAPFWSWNTALNRDRLLRQIGQLKEMGFGGFHIHPRTGLATTYLGPEFMDHIRACLERARAEEMLCWLYDEDRWPSGFAGGLVTQEVGYRLKHLLFTPLPYNGSVDIPLLISAARGSRNENGTLLARYLVTLEDGYLSSYRRLADLEDAPGGDRVWYAYLESAVPSPWWNNQTYVDTLDAAAIARFIAITHERYFEAIGADFGTLVPAIFTDEPQFVHKSSLRRAEDAADLYLPWTTDFAADCATACGEDPLDTLPEVFWELPGGRPSIARYRYHEYLAERFACTFADQVGKWCTDHGIALTGHMMEEPTLQSQTAALGEAMRSYRAFDLPGIDILGDRPEYTTAKQAQSAAHQYGRQGVMSELYGVTSWDFDFTGHKGQGDWQAALGVTVRVPHLSWVSMAGESKRDYPASLNYQAPWFREYPLVEDHFARLNVALTRGTPCVRVGVVHPIESYWLCFGPLDQTGIEREERDTAFADLTRWLLFGLVDFDFIAESLLPELCPLDAAAEPCLRVGAMRYDVIVVPNLRTIRATTLDRLERFVAAGGALLFAGEIPSLVDVLPSSRARDLAARSVCISHTRGALLGALAPWRELEVRLDDGRVSDSLLGQVRDDGDRRIVFLCNTDRDRERVDTRIVLHGRWEVTVLDTLAGSAWPLIATIDSGRTALAWEFSAHGSLLLQLDPRAEDQSAEAPVGAAPRTRPWVPRSLIADPVPVTLAEPNVLLLDQAAYRLDQEEWQPVEEVLRIDNILRTRLDWPLKMDAVAQPWIERDAPRPEHTVSLRFTIESDIDVNGLVLALEDAAKVRIMLDGLVIPSHVSGWWVDEAIYTVPLPPITAGRHSVTLEIPYGRLSDLEWCYVLGEFGVYVAGRHARLIAPVRELSFGDWATQGLPFYAGNVTYHCTGVGDGNTAAVRLPAFKGALARVALDDTDMGPIAFAPFRCGLGKPRGAFRLDLTIFGNRANAFGPVHNAERDLSSYGPPAWRSQGDTWAYEYQLRPMGILVAPVLETSGGDDR
jgi:hypothetical protein